ncbi:hypothetical protein HAX54_001577, partial [Datura stramonium]|nr:hypothetical protein [Datura stramonium]
MAKPQQKQEESRKNIPSKKQVELLIFKTDFLSIERIPGVQQERLGNSCFGGEKTANSCQSGQSWEQLTYVKTLEPGSDTLGMCCAIRCGSLESEAGSDTLGLHRAIHFGSLGPRCEVWCL